MGMGNQVDPLEPPGQPSSSGRKGSSAEALTKIWMEVLRVPEVEAQANFFDIGGDSMKAMEVIVRAGEALGVDLPLMAFFEDPTIAHLAQVIDELRGDGDTAGAVAKIWAEVLRTGEVDGAANFFDIGGDSMKAMEVITRVSEALGVELPLMAFFEDPTVAHLAAVIDELKGVESGATSMVRVPGRREFPLSYSQQVFWLLAQQNRGTGLYNTARIFRVRGSVDAERLERSLNELRRRHEILRVRFEARAEGLVQVVDGSAPLRLEVKDFTLLSREEAERAALAVALETVREPFDLERGPVLRTRLARISAEEALLCLAIHHVVSDGFTGSILLEELAAIYDAYAESAEDPLPEVELHFTDYAAWEREWMAGSRLEEELAYWQETLRGAPTSIDLPLDGERSSEGDRRGHLRTKVLPVEDLRRLQGLAQEHGTTLFTILAAGLRMMLSRWSGQKDFLIGTIASNRSRSHTERMVGCFVNPLALRNALGEGERVLEVIAREKSAVMEAFAHQDCPFAKLVEKMNPERRSSDNPLFNVALLLQSFPTIEVHGRHFHAKDVNFDAQVALLDIRFIATESAEGLAIDSEYSTSLFTSDTVDDLLATYMSVLRQMASTPGMEVAQIALSETLTRRGEEHRRARQRQTIAVAANFTAEPIGEPLAFWMEQLRTPSRIEFAPFDQVFQQLLDPGSLLGSNADGFNVVLIEWRAGRTQGEQARELAGALKGFAARAGAPMLVCVCPPAGRVEELAVEDQVLATELAGCAGVSVVYAGQIQERYPVEHSRDPFAEAVGAIPYTPEFFVAAATMLARRMYGLRATPLKVIALDCDHTLWKGVCGEEGPLGVVVDGPRRALQEFMLEQKEAGMLLCLCSKNAEADVDAVFEKNPGMVLGRSDFVAARVNWEAKSANLHDLARELGLGVDSFIFVDDNPLECAEVRAHCAGTVVLELPAQEAGIPHRLRQMWGFDHWTRTREDRQRSELYRQAQEREQARTGAEDLREFLRGLELKVEIRRMEREDLARVAQLTQRTNQFNCSTVRRSESEVERLGERGRECLVVEVRDRFGDYGLVGVAIYEATEEALRVETLLLSCRVLGRKVEHHVLARLGEIAVQHGLAFVDVEFAPTEKNRPALDFLEGLEGGEASKDGAGQTGARTYRFAAAYACVAQEAAEAAVPERKESAPVAGAARSVTGVDLERIASGLGGVQAIARAMQSRSGKQTAESGSRTARNATEEILAGIWAGLLHTSVGPDDDFFRLGGNSLLAVQVLSRVRQVLGVEMALRTMFEEPTLAGFAGRIEAAKRAQTGLVRPPLVKAARQGTVSASFAQQRLWFIDQLEPGHAIYNIPQMIRMRGPLHIEALARSLTEIVRRHESLRTTFTTSSGQPLQVIGAPVEVPLALIDLSHLPIDRLDAEVKRLAMEEAVRPFDLARGLMLRARLLVRGAEDHVLLIVLHHIAGDRWSAGILAEEMEALYAAYVRGEGSPLPEPTVQYADFSAWQRGWLEGEELKKQADYWREQLADAPAVLELPTDRPRPPVLSHRGSTETTLLPMDLVERLTGLSQGEGVTLFMTLLAALQTLLSRYSGQEDVVVGSPIAGRNVAEVEPLIGFFVNTVALRTDLTGDPSFRDLLHRVRGVALGAYAHQDIPFERLVEELQPERSLSYQPVFQTIFALQNAPQRPLELAGLRLERLPLHQGTSAFDLSWFATHVAEGLQLRVEYSTDLFDAATIGRAMEHFRVLLEGIVADPERRISELELLGADERRVLLEGFNDTETEHPRTLCLHDFVTRQAHATPAAIALVDGERRVSYAELNRRANQVAHYLMKRGAGPDVLVGICGTRSADLLVGILGILKSGSAYVPLDPNYPTERLVNILEDARAPLVLFSGQPTEVAERVTGECIDLDAAWSEIAQESDNDPETGVTPHHLGYVLFTSGSTGRPKGVALEHRSAAAFIEWAGSVFSQEELAGVLLSTSVCFDLSVFEIFVTWSVGGKVIVAENALYLPLLPARDEVTLINTVPSAIAELMRMEGVPDSVRTVNLAGEALPSEIVEWIYASTRVQRVYNLYGPTEDTTYSTYTPVRRGGPVTIGRPIANTQCYVLDVHRKPTPIGMPGELYLAGEGLARGYYGRPEMTAERFVRNPFSLDTKARMYRTGDRSRWLANGELQYLGRLDQQVKLRGFRIELGEIEATLNRHAGVERSIVMVREDEPGMPRLVAYVVTKPGALPTAETLQEHVRESLPDFMVPSAVVMLASFPVTANGKIERKALPVPDAPQGKEYVSPRNAVEQGLAEIWAEVLHVPRVGVTDNFFAMGGHSLLATQVIARIRRDLHAELPLRAVFEAPTIAGMALRLAAPDGVTSQSMVGSSIPRVPRDRPIPLSFAQERLWFLDLLEPGNPRYNVPRLSRLRGRLDAEVLQRALDTVVQRHEVLRTTFETRDDRPVQIIHPPRGLPIRLIDLSGWPAAEREAEWQRICAEESIRPFDLAAGPLLRPFLLRLAEDDHVFLINMHHITTERWSQGLLWSELSVLYRAFVQGEGSPLEELPVQYADYAVWQREWLQGEELEEQVSYWRGRLADLTPLEFPTDYPRPAVPRHRGDALRRELPPELVARLMAFSRNGNATLYMTMLAAFKVLLMRYTGHDDVVIGTVIAGRTQAELERLIGFFVNTLVLRTDLSGNPTFQELLTRIKETSLGAYSHQDIPFEKLVEELRPERSLNHNPFFQVAFVHDQVIRGLSLPGLEVEGSLLHQGTSVFDLTWYAVEHPDGIRMFVEYDTELFRRETIERMLDCYLVALESAMDAPETPVAELSILPAAQRDSLLYGFNDTQVDVRDARLHELVAEQAARRPDAIAVRFEGAETTYRELDGRANQLAHYLGSAGVRAGMLVGVCAERSLEMVVALLGIQKAGAGYVPIDPEFPKARMEQVIADIATPVLLTQAHLLPGLPASVATVLCLDRDWKEVRGFSTVAPVVPVMAANVAYAIYTSGSTGKPKGVPNTHRGIVNRLLWMQHAYGLRGEDRVLQKTPYSFDVSVWEFFWPLMQGATLVMAVPQGHKDPEYLVRTIQAERITTMHFVPSMLRVFLESPGVEECSSLQRVFCSGEALSRDIVNRFFERLPGVRLHNLYGPTEAAVDVTYIECLPDAENATVPIGRPVWNTQLYILSAQGALQPIGVPGELYLAGVQLAKGYLNRPDLTSERFVAHPFAAGERAYRTGDLCRWLPEGSVEYLGRMDQQVKLRGFRIEPGEVEVALRQHGSVSDCVVIVREDVAGDQRLVAYVVARAGRAVSAEELRSHLGASLPEYMIPAAIVALEAMPLSTNGKVDRKALPAPEYAPASGQGHRAETAVQQVVAAIWCEVLKLEAVHLEDDFFELGGHSLLATQVLSRVRAVLKVEISLRSLFEQSTLGGFAQQVEQARAGDASVRRPITRVTRDEALACSFAQQRLWFVQRLHPERTTYNMPATLRLRGELKIDALEHALHEIVGRHETLRTVFAMHDDEPVQVILPHRPAPMPQVDLTSVEEPLRLAAALRLAAEEAATPFDLARGPMYRFKLLRLSEQDHVLIVVLHHINTDGWSSGVLWGELSELYRAQGEGRAAQLPELTMQYADFAAWQREWLTGDTLAVHLNFWRRFLAGAPEVLRVPADHDRPVESDGDAGACFHTEHLSAELTGRISRFARQQSATPFMVLLSAFYWLLAELTKERDIVIGTDLASRTTVETERLIGFFINVLPLRARMSGEETFAAFLAGTRNAMLEAFAHQEMPFDKLVQELSPERGRSSNPLVQVLFVMENATRSELQLPGIEATSLPSPFKARFDLSLFVTPGETTRAAWMYDAALFEAGTVRRFATLYRELVSLVVESPATTFDQAVDRLTAVERAEIEAAQLEVKSASADRLKIVRRRSVVA